LIKIAVKPQPTIPPIRAGNSKETKLNPKAGNVTLERAAKMNTALWRRTPHGQAKVRTKVGNRRKAATTSAVPAL
jgi:hypothetical protein